ncbi:MAG: hypothetical protein ACK5NN_05445 [Sphingomonadaceae bacterium]
MNWKPRNLRELARMVVGDAEHFPYRSSKYITEFFEDCELEFVHTGATRSVWAAERIEEVLAMPHPTPSVMPDAFLRIIRRLLDKGEAEGDDADRAKALAALNIVLAREGWAALYDENGLAQLRHIATNTIAEMANPHRPFTPSEIERRDQLFAASANAPRMN